MIWDILTGNIGLSLIGVLGLLAAMGGLWLSGRRSGVKKEQSKKKDEYIATRKELDKVKKAPDIAVALDKLLRRKPRGDM